MKRAFNLLTFGLLSLGFLFALFIKTYAVDSPKGGLPYTEQEKQAWGEIEKYRQLVKDAPTYEHFISLGFHLQQYERDHHKGSGFKEEAVKSYEKALEIFNSFLVTLKLAKTPVNRLETEKEIRGINQMKLAVLDYASTIYKEIGNLKQAHRVLSTLLSLLDSPESYSAEERLEKQKSILQAKSSNLLERSVVNKMMGDELNAVQDLLGVLHLDYLPSAHLGMSFSTYTRTELEGYIRDLNGTECGAEAGVERYTYFDYVEKIESAALSELRALQKPDITSAETLVVPNIDSLDYKKLASTESAMYTAMRFFSLFEIYDRLVDYETGIQTSAEVCDGDLCPESSSGPGFDLFHFQDRKELFTHKAWKYLELANKIHLKSRFSRYSVSESVDQMELIKSVFSDSLLKLTSNHTFDIHDENRNKNIIFVVGLPRSGSTLLEKILESHSKVCGLGEDTYFNAELNPFKDKLVSQFQNPIHSVQELLNTESARILNLEINSVYNVKQSTVVVDKMLFNFQNIGFIHMLLPGAKVIHVYKSHDYDAIYSLFKKQFQGHTAPWSYDLSFLQVYLYKYRQLIDFFTQKLPQEGFILDFPYEELVRNPETTVRELLAFCGLDFEDKVLDFIHKKTKPAGRSEQSSNEGEEQEEVKAVHTHSQFQVNKPLYNTSIHSYKKYKSYMLPYITNLSKDD